ncbi:SDR family NAD(P)-dependent oxidoreductase [Leptolyngbya cf. ectocarpi LEGE 11479]|uniref:SDR family NAD(P)-dependent oxidoreductase n=1 Tax=Leptolyngbya cf. ectocarpi LEGE 11479 TaxID=1828722 RepID=A0A928ZTR9_LEPEC|nr:SDR family NAD(P)-dependent oxidoreductase [Leptolyngbya ectocarpi]MBE9066914.1 SDR family NAD(P)-dependent oxidoreductase [Leptolyngbya cf. ectocarpi LEGE 11479]
MTIFSSIHSGHALVVGGNRGIGLGFVRQLLSNKQFAHIFATYRTESSSTELLKLAQADDRLHCLAMDITDETQIENGLADLKAIVPQLHVVINCVGFLHEGSITPEKALRQLNPDHLMRYFQVNSIGAALLAKHLLPLLNHPQPNIFATISAKIGSIEDNRLGGWYGYRASKAALNMFLKTAAIEYSRRSKHTAIVLLHPGTTDTRLSEPFQRGVPPDKLFPVEKTVGLLSNVLEQVTLDDNGAFFSWDGSRLPW